MPNKKSSRINDRRKIIFRHCVLGHGTLPVKVLRERLGAEYTADMAKTDARDFQAVGCNIALRSHPDDPSEKFFVFIDGPHTDMHPFRETLNQTEKKLVSRLAAALICGLSTEDDAVLLPEWVRQGDAQKALDGLHFGHPGKLELGLLVRSVLVHLKEKLTPLEGPQGMDSADAVVKLIEHSSLAHDKRQKSLITDLYRFWKESSRLVAIDSGTTNIALAQCLKQLNLPMPGSPLCSLTVCTNSRRIFEVLGPAEVAVRSIIIGGQQKFGSPTIAGTMAELFLRTATFLQFGMCILGSTKVDVEHFAICSDTEEEATLKNLLMEKSSLRIVCADDSKLQIGPGREGYKFASIDPKHIDLIITNSPARTKPNESFIEFQRMIEAIEGRGVPVLIATSSDTYDHPNAVGVEPRKSGSKSASN